MKKNILALPAFFALALGVLSACGGGAVLSTPAPSVPAADAPVDTAAPSGAASSSDAAPTYTDALNMNTYGTRFTLTADEKALYDQFVSTLDKSALKGLDPVSFGKIFIQCGIDAQAKAEYRLSDPTAIGMTEDAYVAASDKDMTSNAQISRQQVADIDFPYLDQGAYVDEGGGNGHLAFTAADGTDYWMYFSTDADGVWQMGYPPIGMAPSPSPSH